MVEISRLARWTALAADFMDVAVDTNTTIHLLDEMIDAIDPDDLMSAFFAKQLSLWYEEERRQTIARIQRAQRHAQREGKWVGQPPTGFTTDDEGYLIVDLEEWAGKGAVGTGSGSPFGGSYGWRRVPEPVLSPD